MKKVNIRKELSQINEYWSQRIIGEANNQLFKLAKGIGETNWHKHDDHDELFSYIQVTLPSSYEIEI